MKRDAIVFAGANPTPEISPWAAEEAGVRIVGTGGSDFANQINNSLVFPPMGGVSAGRGSDGTEGPGARVCAFADAAS
jgi:malic enzyme